MANTLDMFKKKSEKPSRVLELLDEFFLGTDPDFKTMPLEEVTAYLEKNKLDSESVYRATRATLEAR